MVVVHFIEDGDKPKTVRCKMLTGHSVKWRISLTEKGWKPISAGSVMLGGRKCIIDFLPFQVQDDLYRAVSGDGFPTRAEAEAFVRSL